MPLEGFGGWDGTWTVWASNASATTSTSDTNFIWGAWTATGSSTSDVWVTWNTISDATNLTTAYRAPAPAPETEEQRAARAERQRQQQEQARVREAERLVAQERAEQLLRDHLTIEQAAQLVQGNYFEVISESGKRYRINRGVARNVFLMEGARAQRGYCIHPTEDVPAGDSMLAQKLMLENCERDFLRIANEFAAAA